jgi:AcrR family transcriptional regulator
VEAATRIAAGGNYEQFTVRALADELGVSPMSLYRHIDSKDDLLDEVVDNLLGRIPAPSAPQSDWRGYLADAAVRFRRFLIRHPAALHVYLQHPVVSSAAVERMNAMVSVLRIAGCSDDEATRAYATIHTFTIGFAALEARRGAFVAPAVGSELRSRLASFTTPKQFETGLAYVLDGIEADLGRHGGGR